MRYDSRSFSTDVFSPWQSSSKLYFAHLAYRKHSFQCLYRFAVQYVIDRMDFKIQRGEYRIRTDDLLHAMQAL